MNKNIIHSFSEDNNNYALYKNLTFTFSYRGEVGVDNGFKLYIKKSEEDDSSFFFIINPVGIVNPRAKAIEIYLTLVNIAEKLQINWIDIDVILDLLEVNGIEKKHIYEWTFIEKNEKIQDEIREIKDLSAELEKTLSIYYSEKFSPFTNSTLNNKQKAEIAAYALAEKCYDEFSAENIVKNFKMALKKAILQKKTLKTVLSKLLS
ncbi:hypothetical protein [Bacillus wiedmannii]|uniref:hypothetical protein n=1 Tax=Bacillus wiedmannii TaxID=1890302 RepID=UPI0021D26E4E|nr:hypothetical protein [Bacillus wiedmannii]MCU5596207.1 hypothetical protein [Bacillus wiedmannii]